MGKSDFGVGSATIGQYFSFIEERHKIYLKRRAGEPEPWTDDPVLRDYKFTNIFRELDRGTLWLRKHNMTSDLRCRIFNTFMYRMINYWPTFEETGLVTPTRPWGTVKQALKDRWKRGEKVFTSCHMTVGRQFEAKIDTTCETLDAVWKWTDGLVYMPNWPMWDSMELLFEVIKDSKFYGIGPFINYEIVCDLRFESVWVGGGDPTDTCSWANLGPGAKRGLQRLGLDADLSSMRQLFSLAAFGVPCLNMDVRRHHRVYNQCLGFITSYPYFELREIEHSLCEFDKYCRGGGKEKFRASRDLPDQ